MEQKNKRKDIPYSNTEIDFEFESEKENHFKNILGLDYFKPIELLEEKRGKSEYIATVSIENLNKEQQEGILTAIGDLSEILDKFNEYGTIEVNPNLFQKDFSSENSEFVKTYAYFIFSLQTITYPRIPIVKKYKNVIKLNKLEIKTDNEELNNEIYSKIKNEYYKKLGLEDKLIKESNEFKFNISESVFAFFQKLKNHKIFQDIEIKNKYRDEKEVSFFLSLNKMAANYKKGFSEGMKNDITHLTNYDTYVKKHFEKIQKENPEITNPKMIYSKLSKELPPYESSFNISQKNSEFVHGYLFGFLCSELNINYFFFPKFKSEKNEIKINDVKIKVPSNNKCEKIVKDVQSVYTSFLNEIKQIGKDAELMYI